MRQPLAYLDFDLTISAGAGRAYPLRCASPAGEAQETFRLPFDDLQLENASPSELRNALLAPGDQQCKVLTPQQPAVRSFGKALFGALFCGELRSRYDVSRLKAESEGKGLRLRLRVEPPELAALPWEYLYDQRTDAYLALSHHTPLVRYPELPRPVQPLAVTPPLRLLVVVANPSGVRPLDVEREQERIERALRPLVEGGWLAIDYLSPPTWRELQRVLRPSPRRHEYHILHFVGHGKFNRLDEAGESLFEDEQHPAKWLSATKLAHLLADHRRTLHLAVLNACESAYAEGNDPFASTAAAVVAMQFAITDGAAVEFSQAFYESLAEGLPVDAALAEARKAMYVEVNNSVEWGTPALYTHASDGRIFDLSAQPPVGAEKQEGRRAKERAHIQVVTPPPSKPEPLPAVMTLEKADIELLLVPAGEFLMGSSAGEGESDEHPQHTLYLPDYYIARTPTTNAQFARFIQDGGYRWRELWTEAGWQMKEKTGWTQPRFWQDEKWDGLNLPVIGISWYEALAYARWAGGMLPSEAEWEKAAAWDARAGRKRRYPWGDEWRPERCNNNESSPDRTTPVGQYSPAGDSAYGCADMAGNVWEWTRSIYRVYPYDTTDGREDLTAEGLRVLRGGAFDYASQNVRSAARSKVSPEGGDGFGGFRLVVVPGFPSGR